LKKVVVDAAVTDPRPDTVPPSEAH
jgi:hypothetical protein